MVIKLYDLCTSDLYVAFAYQRNNNTAQYLFSYRNIFRNKRCKSSCMNRVSLWTMIEFVLVFLLRFLPLQSVIIFLEVMETISIVPIGNSASLGAGQATCYNLARTKVACSIYVDCPLTSKLNTRSDSFLFMPNTLAYIFPLRKEKMVL